MEDDASQKLYQFSLDHAWHWFEYHANQRMTLIRFCLLVEGALVAGIGYVWQYGEYPFSALLSGYGILAAFCFERLDRRVSNLLKLGEGALKHQQNHIAILLKYPDFEICRLADENHTSEGHRRFCYPYTYGENIRLLLRSAMVAFALLLSLSIWAIVKASA